MKIDISVIYVRECSMFSSKSFIVSNLIFGILTHFEFICVYGHITVLNLPIYLHVHIILCFGT